MQQVVANEVYQANDGHLARERESVVRVCAPSISN